MSSSGIAVADAPGVELARDDTPLARATMRRVSLRLLPFLFVLFIFNYLDRTNLAIAALQMNRDLRFSATAYSVGAGIFFVGYALLEVPSNLILARIGARRWIARIMVTWGLIAAAMMLVRTPLHFYALRFLLGVAEAGFFPGIIYYLSQWFPAAERARAVSRFMTAVPLSSALGNPVGAWLLGLDGRLGLAGWRWLFILEGIPSVILGVAVLALLTDRHEDARWLSDEERAWLAARLAREHADSRSPHDLPPLRALLHPTVWLVTLTYFLIVTANYGYIFWAPTVIRDALHANNTQTGLITGAIACVAAIAMVVVAASSDRTGERSVHAGASIAVAAAGYVCAAALPTPLARVVGLALVPVGVSASFAPFWCLPTSLLRGSAAAAGIALINSFGNLGGFAGPYVIGAFQDATGGMRGAFISLAGVALAAAALCLAMRRHSAFAQGPRVAGRAVGP